MKYITISILLSLGMLLAFSNAFAVENSGDNHPANTAIQARHEIQTRTMTMAQAKLGELEITMEVIDENVDTVDDVTNTIELPAQIRERIQDRSRLQDDQANLEGAQHQIREMHQYRNEMHNEIKEQQAETIQNMKEQSPGKGGQGKGN